MTKLIYIIAGEPSGDALGARLMQALKRRSANIRFTGIGGPRMQEEGLHSLFPMQEIALMGFAEVLPHIMRLKKRISQTVDDIRSRQPDMLITIDSPGFNFRVARRAAPYCHTRVHYVAPTVWAYKPERARKTAEIFGHLLTLFPFEAPYFELENLPVHFVGHPVIESADKPVDIASFRARHSIPAQQKLLAVLPGSRGGELKRHLPVLRETVDRLARTQPQLGLLLPVDERWVQHVRQETAGWKLTHWVVDSRRYLREALLTSQAALTKSGTITLDVALANIPMATYHRVNPLSAFLMRRWIRTPYFNLINILEQQPIVPELMQENCTPENLAETAEALLTDTALQERQKKVFRHALAKLRPVSGKMPSEEAADVILSLLISGAQELQAPVIAKHI